MFFLLFLFSFGETLAVERVNLQTVVKRISLDTDQFFLDASEHAFLHDGRLWLVDTKTLVVFGIRLEDKDIIFWGKEGPAPFELRRRIWAFYPQDGQLSLYHGSMNSRFDTRGSLVDSEKGRWTYALYLGPQAQLFREGSRFILAHDTQTLAFEGFSVEEFGFGIRVAKFGPHILIASAGGKDDRFAFFTLDLERGHIQSVVTVEKEIRQGSKPFPPSLKRRARERGIDPSHLKLTATGVITTCQERGFLIPEYDLFAKERKVNRSVVHTVNPETGLSGRIRISHSDWHRFSFFIPWQEHWVVFDSNENEVIIFSE